MALELSYDKKEDVPEAHAELYTEADNAAKDGKVWTLTGINGLVTKVDVDKLNVALGKERTDHKATKEKVKVWGDMDQEKVVKDLAELTELRAAADAGTDAKGDKEKFEVGVKAAAEARIVAAKVTSDREIADLKKIGVEQTDTITGYKNADTVRTIGDDVLKACISSKVIESARPDVLMNAERVFEINDEGLVLTRDQVGVTPGIAAEIWLSEMQEKRPHWWPTSTGGGAGGNKGDGGFDKNPWSNEHWNLTNQAAAIRENKGKAERMAAAAGTSIGAPRPVQKVKA